MKTFFREHFLKMMPCSEDGDPNYYRFDSRRVIQRDSAGSSDEHVYRVNVQIYTQNEEGYFNHNMERLSRCIVKNTMLINGDYHHMHTSIQNLINDKFKEAEIWAIREPQNVFHGPVPADIFEQYYDQHSIKEFRISDVMTYYHPHRKTTGRVLLQRWIFEVKTMRVDSHMNE